MYRVPLRRFLTLLLFIAAASFLSQRALSQEVLLALKGGDLTIRGKLISFDDKNYVIEAMSLGRITVSREKFSCAGQNCPPIENSPNALQETPAETVRVQGSGEIGARLVPQLVRDYSDSIGAVFEHVATNNNSVSFAVRQDRGSLIRIDVHSDDSGSVVEALAEGKADIGLTSRQITDSEIGTLTRAGFVSYGEPLNQFVIGVDGIAVIVSPDNPITAISLEDISRIFGGEITDWAEFGAPAGPIRLYSPAVGSDLYQAFTDQVLKTYKRDFRARATTLQSDDELAEAVAADRFGIGFVGIRHSAPASPLGVKDTCGLVHTPSTFTVLSGEYPISRRLYLHTSDQGKDVRSEIVRFVLSGLGDRAVERAGFVSKSIRTLPFDFFRTRIISSVNVAAEKLNIDLLRELMSDLDGGYRLSTTLRFESSSVQLEKESSEALGRLIAYLKEQDLPRRKILLAGYSDTSGNAQQNRALSLRRAEAARQTLLDAAEGALTDEQTMAKGYGELFPISCNDTEAGRDRNRRVEIWLLPSNTVAPSLLTKQF